MSSSEGCAPAWPGNPLQKLQGIALDWQRRLTGNRPRVGFTVGTPFGRKAPKRVTFATSAPFAAIIPGDSVVEAVVTTGLGSFLNLYNSALIVRLVLTWFPNPPQVIVGPLSTLCDPYLNLFRGLIPPLGGTLDFSPILAFVVLSLFSNTAAALPAELKGAEAVDPAASTGRRVARCNLLPWSQGTRYQQAWERRRIGQNMLKLQGKEGGRAK